MGDGSRTEAVEQVAFGGSGRRCPGQVKGTVARNHWRLDMLDNLSTQFPHHKMQVYQVGLELLVAAKKLSDSVPRDYRSFADQLLRAAGAAVAGTTEGANRRTAGRKRDAFGVARAEAGEAAGHAECLAVMGLVDEQAAREVIELAARVAAMLTRLVQRHS